VFGPRGGSGTTFLACQLAASLADERLRCVLVDLDADFADVTVALGIDRLQGDVRTLSDLTSVMEELTPEHVADALYPHPRGFGVLLAARDRPADPSGPELYAAAVTHLSFSHQIVVLHLPRSLDRLAMAGLSLSDEVVLLIAPDTFSLHAARRAIGAFGLGDDPGRCRIVVNQLSRGGLRTAEIERILGRRPSATLRFDPAVGRAQDRGELLSARAHGAARDVRLLARQLVTEGASTPSGEEGRHVR